MKEGVFWVSGDMIMRNDFPEKMHGFDKSQFLLMNEIIRLNGLF